MRLPSLTPAAFRNAKRWSGEMPRTGRPAKYPKRMISRFGGARRMAEFRPQHLEITAFTR